MGLFFFQIFFCQLDVIVAVVFVVIVEVVLSSSNIKHNEVIYIWCHFFCVIARGERERGFTRHYSDHGKTSRHFGWTLHDDNQHTFCFVVCM